MSAEKKDRFEQLLKNHLAVSLSRPRAESCPDENWMVAYLEGSQSEHFKKSFEQHLLQCDRCQAELALLLKTGVTAQQKASAVVTESRLKNGFLGLLFGWTRATTFRPVFAILLVSVLTGIVGYRLLRDDRVLRDRATEIATHRSSPLGKVDESATAPSVDVQKSKEPKQGLESESRPVRGELGKDRLQAARVSQGQPSGLRDRRQTNSLDSGMKDAYAVEPSTVPSESGRDAVGGPNRRDGLMTPQSMPDALRKESLSAAVVDRQNPQLQAKVDEASAKPRNQVMPASPMPAARSVVGGALSERKNEQDKLANAEEARAAGTSAKKKQVLAEAAGQATAVEANEDAVSRIEVSGKRFDLSDGVWRDSSILPDDPWPTLVSMNSADFEKYRKQLAPYQPVLSRPEDVVIKLHNRVYRIQKAPR